MTMDRLGVAILGVGGVSLGNHIPGLVLCPGVHIAALADPSPEALARGAALCPAAAKFTDPAAALAAPGVDAVVVATPNINHKALVLAAVRAGKHVMCEKPLALSLSDAREMHAAAVGAGVRHMTAFTYTSCPRCVT